jgi:uncharacterized protein HemX
VNDRTHTRQLIGSLLVAALIVAAAILVVTLKFGPTSAAELDAAEERREQRLDAQEQRRKDAEDRRKEQGEDR